MYLADKTCAVAINMGATKTGVCCFVGTPNRPLTKESVYATTIVTPTDSDGITFSSASRTTKRHNIRNKTRFKLARLLMNAIADFMLEIGGQDLKPKQVEKIHDALASLLRRRGFTYADTDLTIFDQLDASLFLEHPVLNELAETLSTHPFFGPYFGTAKEDDIETCDFDKIEVILAQEDFPSKRTFKTFVKEEKDAYPDADPVAYSEALGALIDEATATASVRSRGRKSRRAYQATIMGEIADNLTLRPLLPAVGGDTERLAKILLHISNLELRALRRYFEDSRVIVSKCGFDAQALKEVFYYSFKRHMGGVSHIHAENPAPFLVRTIRECEAVNLLDMLGTLDPALTIPPFERLTNRGTPNDLTLFLSPEKLTKHYPKWTSWADKLLQANPELDEDLDEILSHVDRKSRRSETSKKGELKFLRLAYVLHRALDRSKALDPYALRIQAIDPKDSGVRTSIARKRLTDTLGAQNVEPFLIFAHTYYAEVEQARIGLFFPEETKLFERADIHPPRIQKILPFLIADILRCDPHEAEDFVERVWTMPVGGRRTVKSACKFIEETRKDFGLLFNREYKEALTRNQRDLPREEGDKSLLDVAKFVDVISQTIAEAMEQDESVRQKYANPFSLAQLYTLLEVQRSGFSSISVAARLENSWRNRMVTTTVDGKDVTCANGVRLPADSVRPFDGVTRKVLDRQAYEVSKIILDVVKHQKTSPGELLHIPLLVEHNRFSFDLSLSDLKRVKNERAEKGMKREETRWIEKDERVRSMNAVGDDSYICPFTGNTFERGQFVTILSPKDTRSEGRSYDVEANLIYCSLEGRRESFKLQSLHPKYLKHVFGTDVVFDIEARIETEVATLVDEKRLAPFHQLTKEEQIMVRHALFLNSSSKAYRAVLSSIRHQHKTTTNGSQAWFIRCLLGKLKRDIQPWSKHTQTKVVFSANITEPENTSRIRRTLAKVEPAYDKSGTMSAMNTVIDAACVGASGWNVIREGFDPSISLRNVEVLANLLPKDCKLVRIVAKKSGEKCGNKGKTVDAFTKPVFKDTIYGEDFLPLFSTRGKLYVGFRPMKGLVAEVEGTDREGLLQRLLPFFDQKTVKPLDDAITYTINKTKAFAFLDKLAHQETSDPGELEQASLLESLHYFTIRPSLSKVLLTKTGDKMKSFEDMVTAVEAGTCVKLAVKSVKRGLFKASGIIGLPLRHEWMKLIQNEHLATLYGEAFTSDKLDHLMPKLRPDHQVNRHAHRPNRWSVSLPMVVSASGTPVRIKRHNYRGEKLYQTQTVTTSSVGFEVKKGKIDWNSTTLPEHLTREAFTVFGRRKKTVEGAVGMDEWRLVADKPFKLWMSPGTSDRRRVRLEAPFEMLKPWLNALNPKLTFTKGSDLPTSLVFKAGEVNIVSLTSKLFGEDMAKLLDKPKTRILFIRIGENIALTYTTSSSTKAMCVAFNKGH